MNDFAKTVLEGAKTGWKSFITLSKVMIPVYIGVQFLQHTPILDYLGRQLAPLMSLFGLPGEAAVPLVLANFVNIYAAIAAAEPLTLSVQQTTVLAIMAGISHSQIMEAAIVRQMRVPYALIVLLRLTVSGLVGMLVARV